MLSEPEEKGLLMEFCPVCGSLLLPASVNGRKVLKCKECGYVSEKSNPRYKVTETIARSPLDKVAVVDLDFSTLPVVTYKCESCGNDKAYAYEVQTRAGDEPATRFYICTKCRKVYREYA
ncbi:MAG: transcription factor S [Thermofilum sp.]